jgi:hypothetical protein
LRLLLLAAYQRYHNESPKTPNLIQSKSITHASHLGEQISLVLSPFIGQISYILMGDPSFVLDPSFYGIFAVSPPALLCTPRFTKTV